MNKTVKRKDEQWGIYLYILELQNGKYYVGITNDPDKRFRKQKSGKSICFINKNLPIINIHKTLLKTTDRNRALQLESEKAIEQHIKIIIYNELDCNNINYFVFSYNYCSFCFFISSTAMRFIITILQLIK